MRAATRSASLSNDVSRLVSQRAVLRWSKKQWL